MSGNNNIHWAGDEHLVAEYVMQRIPDVEREALEAHLQECADCSAIVRREATLAAGAKLAARQALRSRLQDRLAVEKRAASSRERIPWPRILSAAAVVMIILAVGVYNNWFKSRTPDNGTAQQKIAMQEPPSAGEKDRVAGNTPAVGSDGSKQNNEQSKVGKSTDEQPIYAAKKSTSANPGELASREERKSEPVTETPASTLAAKEENATSSRKDYDAVSKGIAGESRNTEMAARQNYGGALQDKAAPASAIIDGANNSGVWVEGVPIRTTYHYAPSVPLSGEAQQSMKQSGDLRTTDDLEPSRLAANAFQGNAVVITQLPSSSLSRSQQMMQNSRGTIQTLLESEGNVLRMTLFLDRPVSEAELQRARVREVNQDSMVIFLSGQRIGYRLSPEIQSRVNLKTRQVK
jgi:hypothetical protein